VQAIALLAACAMLLILPSAALAGAQAGKVVYDTNCSSCHGPTGKGDGPVGQALNPRPRDFSTGDFKFDTDNDGTTGSDTDLDNVIAKGGSAFGGSPLMAPWAHLPEKDRQNVIAYIRSLKVSE
jgi:mono/diheme cytochrome c family protein